MLRQEVKSDNRQASRVSAMVSEKHGKRMLRRLERLIVSLIGEAASRGE